MKENIRLSTLRSTRAIHRMIAFQDSRRASAMASDMGFLPAWFKHDSSVGESGAHGHLNWGAISGLALSLTVSASAWAGVAWIVTRVWR